MLKEIAATLEQHGDLEILIKGRTDNVGSAASNLTLSEAGATAVKAARVQDFAADEARITTIGLGDTKPASVSSNDPVTPKRTLARRPARCAPPRTICGFPAAC